MGRVNQHLGAAVIGMQNPITFNPDYQNAGMIQQLINLISLEGTDADQHRLYLDEMSPACRDSLYLILTDLRDAAVDESLAPNGGDPFTATTGWADSGTEAANNALSEDDTSLIATITAGSDSDLNVYTTITTVIGVMYRAVFSGLTIAGDGSIVASNATTLASPLGETEVLLADSPIDSTSVEFVATATTTYVGVIIDEAPDGVAMELLGFSIVPVVPDA